MDRSGIHVKQRQKTREARIFRGEEVQDNTLQLACPAHHAQRASTGFALPVCICKVARHMMDLLFYMSNHSPACVWGYKEKEIAFIWSLCLRICVAAGCVHVRECVKSHRASEPWPGWLHSWLNCPNLLFCSRYLWPEKVNGWASR